MRLIALAATITLTCCLAYAHYLQPSPADESQSFAGIAHYVQLNREPAAANDDGCPSIRATLVCEVDGQRIAFPANCDWICLTADSLRPGDEVALRYIVPSVYTDAGAHLGPPIVHEFRPLHPRTTPAATLAMDTPALPR